MSETTDGKSEPQAPQVKELSGRIGKYDILKPLGKGAMGMVYLAHDTILERDVALKVMVAQIADDPELKQRFEREARAVAKMTHPNVVMVFDLGTHSDGSPFIAMELLKGQDLQKAMRAQPPMDVEKKVSVIVQVLAGLAHAHQQGIVHRDIKPANVFINLDGTAKLMDFGVARLTSASMTGTGNIVGTADYMSPEQVKGQKVDGKSDLFSVGCMLFELLAGRRPFHSDNLMAIFYKITHEEPNFDLIPAGEQYDSLLPILKKSLSKSLDDRYQTAYEFAMDLREVLNANATSATAKHALESLGDMEATSVTPSPMTDAPGVTMVPAEEGEVPVSGATVDLGTGRRKGARAGTAVGPGTSRPTAPGKGSAATTVLGTGVGARPVTVAPTRVGTGSAPTVVRPYSRPDRPAARPAPSSGSPVLYSVLGGLTVALVIAGGYIYWKNTQEEKKTADTVVTDPTPAPTPTLAPDTPTTTLPPPPTPEPLPSVDDTRTKAAASLRAAQGALREGNYDRAISAAQKALGEDPGNKEAQRLVQSALDGQKAEGHLRAAETALAKRDFDAASREAEQARGLAPWDARMTSLIGRVRIEKQNVEQAEQQAKARDEQAKASQKTSQITTYLTKATDQLAAGSYDAAIALYDEALKLDPGNATATQGRIGAITAKSVQQAASKGPAAGGKTFVTGKTQTSSVEARGGNIAEGFEESAGVTVKKGSQAAELPGAIAFDTKPASPKGGDRYVVVCLLVNQGSQPIAIKEVIVTTTVNGKRVASPVPSLVASVAPGQRASIFESPDIWKEDTTSWSMQVLVRTARNETYKNDLVWK